MSNTALLERPATTAATRTQPEPAAPLPAAGADLPAVRSPRGFASTSGWTRSRPQRPVSVSPSSSTHCAAPSPSSRPERRPTPPSRSHHTARAARDLDVVRLALQEPGAIARTKAAAEEDTTDEESGVTVDISRKRVLIDGESAAFTYKEFELLQYLVLREGRTIERSELVSALWQAQDDETPGERTIDVHVRRLARSSVATRTSSAPCAASDTASTGTPTSSSATATAPPRPTASELPGVGVRTGA